MQTHLTDKAEFDQLAESLMPEGMGIDREWTTWTVSTELRKLPRHRLERTAPASLSPERGVLKFQLQRWLAAASKPDPTRVRTTGSPVVGSPEPEGVDEGAPTSPVTPSSGPRRRVHRCKRRPPLNWDRSGPNGGLRRYG